MCVAQGVSPGTTKHRPPPAVCRRRQRRRRRHTAGGDSGADAQGYTHAAPLGLLRPFIKVVK